MNLTALRERIKNHLDYSPELQGFNDQIDHLLNEAYLGIWTMKRWVYSQKLRQFEFLPDILPTRDVIAPAASVNANVAKGSRQVTFSASIDRLVPQDWEGAIFDLDNLEYIISKVVSNQQILLDKPFVGTTNTDSTDWVIKKRYYKLPQNCLELLSLSHRDNPSNVGSGALPPYGKLRAILPRRDEELNLRTDYKAAYAEAFVWTPPTFVPPAERLKTTVTSREDANGFTLNSWLEVCWAFVTADGQLGALSQPEIVQFTGVQGTSFNLTIGFVSWDDQTIIADSFQSFDTRPTQYEGLRKVVFWNSNFNRTTGQRLGLPAWKFFNQGGTTRNTTSYLESVIALDTVGSVTINFFNQIDPGNPRYIEIDGQHLRIRPYPRVDAWDVTVTQQAATVSFSKVPQNFIRIGEQRYVYKPPLLAEGTDTPEMPYEFHQLIVYKALEDVYLKLGNLSMSDTYRRRIDDKVKDLERRYCDHIDSSIVRGRFNIGATEGFAPYDYQSLRRLS
jgi:hypothetical protein